MSDPPTQMDVGAFGASSPSSMGSDIATRSRGNRGTAAGTKTQTARPLPNNQQTEGAWYRPGESYRGHWSLIRKNGLLIIYRSWERMLSCAKLKLGFHGESFVFWFQMMVPNQLAPSWPLMTFSTDTFRSMIRMQSGSVVCIYLKHTDLWLVHDKQLYLWFVNYKHAYSCFLFNK